MLDSTGKGTAVFWFFLATAAQSQSWDSGFAERLRAIEEFKMPAIPPSAGDVLNREMKKLRGKPPRIAFARLGYPDRKMIVEGATVYSWVNDTTNLDGSPLHCTVKVIVRASKVASTDFNGNEGACAHFALRLDSTFRPR